LRMALIIADRVREVVSLAGTGNVPLLGVAPVGFQSFVAAVGEGNTTYYAIVSVSGQWETGLGTITSGQLVRTEVYDSSTGSKVDFTSGAKEVFCTPVAAKQVVLNPDGTLTVNVVGNASTATTLQTARTIGGVSFNGSANIDLPGVNTAGNQDTSGNAATVTNGVYTTGDQTIDGTKTFSEDIVGSVTGNAAGTELALSDATGAALVGADDAASGSLFTTVQGFITRLRSSVGAALVGFVQEATGSVQRTAQDKMREIKTPEDFSTLQQFFDASANGGGLFFGTPGVRAVDSTIKVPSNSVIHFMPGFVLRAANGLNADVLQNANPSTGNSNISWSGHLAIDGNYLNQASGNGITFGRVTDSKFAVLESGNCKGHGVLFSECDRNIVEDIRADSNGKTLAAYGFYLFNSSENEIGRARVDDNCIGIAVEASGAGKSAVRNTLKYVKARNNRGDYSQSGAGIHFEESAGGNAGDNVVIYPDCRNSTGVGINLTDVNNIRIIEPVLRDNAKTGLAALQSLNIQLIGGEAVGNAATEGAGYRSQIRFDDGGLTGCTGSVIGLLASGSENAVKTFSSGCAMQFISCDLSGTVAPYSLAGVGDSISGPTSTGFCIEPRKPMFRAGRTTSASSGVIVFDSEIIDTRNAFNPATGVYTAPVAGTYGFSANATDAGGARIVIQLQQNGSTVAEASAIGGSATDSAASIPLTPVLCAAGDTFRVNLAVGTAVGGNEKTYFCGFLLG
jgi:hypothetical protein